MKLVESLKRIIAEETTEPAENFVCNICGKRATYAILCLNTFCPTALLVHSQYGPKQ